MRHAPRAHRTFWRATCRRDHQRRRRCTRASHPGAARRAHDSRPPAVARRPQVAIIGDIAHSRVARFQRAPAGKFGSRIVLCGPASLLPAELAQLAPGVTLTTDIPRGQFAMPRPGRDHSDAARATGAATRSVVPASEYFRFYGLQTGAPGPGPARTPSSCTPARSTAAASFLEVAERHRPW